MAAKQGEAGINVGFQNLQYSVKLKPKKGQADAATSKTIISDASGVCKAGRLLAIMGPSGAGKTSLLDILAGRKNQTEGSISLGLSAPTTPTEIQRYSAYVQQDDAIMSTQTAREAVAMAGFLTLPSHMPTSEKLDRVDAIMKTFQLDGCADTLVGDPVGKVKGLSGGERKRCAVAMVAIREPKIVFLDEPTSGLDAFKALTLVQVLKGMASGKNSTVICTIHQPSSDIFGIFDDLMLLFFGRTVFHAAASQAVHYFGQVGYVCPQYANPADFIFMHILRTDSDSRAAELDKAWTGSADFANVNSAVKEFFAEDGTDVAAVKSVGQTTWSGTTSMWIQFQVLLRRGFNDVKRNKMRGRAFIAQSIVMGIILSLIWFQVTDDQKGVQDRAGVLFFITANGMMQNVMGVLTNFSAERGAVLREQDNGMYGTFPYFISRVLCDMPLKIIGPSLFGTIAYWCVGFQPEIDRYLTCLSIIVLLALTGNSVGLFLACIFPDVAVALAVAPLILLPLIMFSGFVINPDSIPVFLKWVEWVSPTKYAFAALAQNEFGGLSLRCTAEQLQRIVTPKNEIITVCGFPSGDAYLKVLNIAEFLSIRNCVLLLITLSSVFLVLAYFGLVWVSNKNKAKAKAKAKA